MTEDWGDEHYSTWPDTGPGCVKGAMWALPFAAAFWAGVAITARLLWRAAH